MNLQYEKMHKRGIAFMIDEIVITILRVVILSISGFIFFKSSILEFKDNLIAILQEMPEDIALIPVIQGLGNVRIPIGVRIFAFLFTFIGVIYNLLMYKFNNGQTFGKIFTKSIVLKLDNQTKISTGDAITRIILSLCPYFLPIVAYFTYINIHVFFAIALLILWIFWYDPWIFMVKKGLTMHDFLSKTAVYSYRSDKREGE